MNLRKICDPEHFMRKTELSCPLGIWHSTPRDYRAIISAFNKKAGNVLTTKKEAWQLLNAMLKEAKEA